MEKAALGSLAVDLQFVVRGFVKRRVKEIVEERRVG